MCSPDLIGGGIGGLACALALAQRGFSARVFEQASAFGEIGAGIQLSPNCVRVLHALGLEPALRRVAFLPEGTEMRDWRTGRMISTTALGRAAVDAYGFPYYHVHRADLIDALAERAHADPRIALLVGGRIEQFEESADAVAVQCGGETHHGALVVGADGIHSVVRAQLFGAEAPRFTGNIAWRALVPSERLRPGLVHPVATVWMGPGKHFVHYYVRGGALINCVCVVEKAGWQVESWTERGEHTELRRDFAGWHETVDALIANMDPTACFKWALFDRAPLPRWSSARATLLGDACHPTLPFMAQGAAMAIEDAAVLAECVATANAVPDALARYEKLRRSRTARIQLGSRGNAKLFHLRPPYSWLRNRALAKGRPNPMDWVFRYDALNAARDERVKSELPTSQQ